MMKLTHKLDENEQCVLELFEDDKPLGWMALDATDLSGLISSLAKVRMMMKDEIPPTLDPGSRMEVVMNPDLSVDGKDKSVGKQVYLRHPGHGWLGFGFSQEDSEFLADALTRWAE